MKDTVNPLTGWFYLSIKLWNKKTIFKHSYEHYDVVIKQIVSPFAFMSIYEVNWICVHYISRSLGLIVF